MEIDLTHARLLVVDYSSCFKFYRDVLGLKVAWGDETTGYSEFSAGTARLALFSRDEMAKVVGTSHLPQDSEAKDRVNLVFRVADVDELYLALKAHHVTFLTEPESRREWGIRTAHFRDPDGNLVEINQKL